MHSMLSHYGHIMDFYCIFGFDTSKCTTSFVFLPYFIHWYFQPHSVLLHLGFLWDFILCCMLLGCDFECLVVPGSSHFSLECINCSSYPRAIVFDLGNIKRIPSREFIIFYLWKVQGVGNKKAPFPGHIFNKLLFFWGGDGSIIVIYHWFEGQSHPCIGVQAGV